MRLNAIRLILMIFGFSITVSTAFAQDEVIEVGPTPVVCGSITESSFSSNYEAQSFSIDVNAGEALDVYVTPLGGGLESGIAIFGPTNLGIIVSDGEITGRYVRVYSELQPKVSTDSVSAPGTYTIRVYNFRLWNYYYEDDDYRSYDSPGGIGVYTLSIGCTLADGTVINPGDAVTPPVEPQNETVQDPPTTFSGFGFPGLAPVDFSNVAKLPIAVGSGVITPTGGEILGYTLDANAGDVVDLTINRVAGNLNLGLVVLSAENQVVFQASLVTSSTMNTRFTLPSGGQYTIGVFRIDLLPPAAPEATAFQITATLNPA